MDRLFVRDEREANVDQAGDRLAYIVLSFGLLAIVAYRSFVDGVASWDLLALVLLGGAVGAIYRLWRGVLTRQALLLLGLTPSSDWPSRPCWCSASSRDAAPLGPISWPAARSRREAP